jgi:deazaflavin-dependent oxidoreductase (nitroreductase family)
MNQALLDRIRVMNKYVTNKVLIHLCGKEFGHFAILTHTGRKSGKVYRIPIITEPIPGRFVIALTQGKKVDWYQNVRAKGGCSLYWKKKEYQLIHPEFMNKEAGMLAFPSLIRSGLQVMGIQYYLKFDIQ